MIEITYSTGPNGHEIAFFPDTSGGTVCVANLGDTVNIDCGSPYGELLTPYLDGPRVDALLGLLERWRETGKLQPSPVKPEPEHNHFGEVYRPHDCPACAALRRTNVLGLLLNPRGGPDAD